MTIKLDLCRNRVDLLHHVRVLSNLVHEIILEPSLLLGLVDVHSRPVQVVMNVEGRLVCSILLKLTHPVLVGQQQRQERLVVHIVKGRELGHRDGRVQFHVRSQLPRGLLRRHLLGETTDLKLHRITVGGRRDELGARIRDHVFILCLTGIELGQLWAVLLSDSPEQSVFDQPGRRTNVGEHSQQRQHSIVILVELIIVWKVAELPGLKSPTKMQSNERSQTGNPGETE